jgi:hypothetical protein
VAVTVDQASLAPTAGSTGTGYAESGPVNLSFNTAATVASGALIVVLGFKFRSGLGTHTGSGGGLTWTTVHQVNSGSIMICMLAAVAPSGLASGTALTITATGSGSADWTVTAASYLGVDTSGGAAAAVRAFNGAAASTAAWSSGTVGGNASDLYVGGAGTDGTLRTSTAGGDSVERNDFNSATTSGSITLIDDLVGEASDTIAGTWSGAQAHVAIGAAFIPAAGAAAAIPMLVMAPPIPA